MSGKVTGWVLENSPVVGAARLVLIVLADHAASDGTQAWPSVETIAHEARCSRSTAHRVLRDLEAGGHIERVGLGTRGVVHYRVVMGPTVGRVRSSDGSDGEREGVRSDAEKGPTVGPEPSLTSKEPSTQRNAGGRATATTDPDALPDEFPSEWASPLDEVMEHLVFAATERGAEAPARGSVARAMVKRPKKPWAAVAEKMAHWLVYGNGRDAAAVDVVARWRQWCDKEPDHRPLPAPSGRPYGQSPPRRNGRAGVDEILALKGTLDHLDHR